MKLFLDANILFTAAYSENGISRTLFRLAKTGQCQLIMSAFVIDEARRNLALKASQSMQVCDELLQQVSVVKEPSSATVSRIKQLPLVDKDAPVLAAAVEAGADMLVTGDRRDFGHLYGVTVEGVLVMNPADTLERILGSSN